MTTKELRKVAADYLRSWILGKWQNPDTMTGEQAWIQLDEYSRVHFKGIASNFYRTCSEAQADLFVKEWDKYHGKEI